jgi:hypothetical protein
MRMPQRFRPDSPRASSVGRLLILCSWILPLILLLEVAARFREFQADTRGRAFGEEKVLEGQRADETAWAAVRGGRLPLRDMEVYAASFGKSPEQLRTQVEERRELIVFCDAQGKALQTYAPTEPEYLARAAQAIPAGACPCDLLAGEAQADCQRMVADPLTASYQGPRYYRAQPSGPLSEGSDWATLPAPPGGNGPAMAIFVRPSIWTEPFVALRPGGRRCDTCEQRGNNVGFRGRDVALPKPDGVVRIACIGGSTTMEGKADELTYPALLETGLRQRLGSGNIEVVNCGIDVMDSSRLLENFDRYLALEPDIIVHYNFINDLPALLPQWSGASGPGLDDRLRGALRASTFLYRYANGALLPREERLTSDINGRIIENYHRMAEMARAAGVEMVFCSFAYPDVRHLPDVEADFFNYKINNQPWGWQRIVDMESYGYLVRLHNTLQEAFCQKEGITQIVLPPELNAGLGHFYDICHLHQSGISSKAAAIETALLSRARALLDAKGAR